MVSSIKTANVILGTVLPGANGAAAGGGAISSDLFPREKIATDSPYM